mmetsp:Transcript_30646/g.51299  ORF Transcript_30646/g.51299 Transcript_30646/m.51299 type:complete len:90 (-) Transcript_30646:334-603(-)
MKMRMRSHTQTHLLPHIEGHGLAAAAIDDPLTNSQEETQQPNRGTREGPNKTSTSAGYPWSYCRDEVMLERYSDLVKEKWGNRRSSHHH